MLLIRKLSFSFLLIFLVLCPVSFAQTSRGTVTGTVTDASGASVPGATIDLQNKQTGVVRSTTSNESGIYRFDAVDPGEYDVTVKSGGFRTYVSRSIPIEAAQTAGINAVLEVGDAASSVEVTSDSVLLQTEAPVRGGNITAREAVALPVFTRNPNLIAVTLPGVTEQRADLPGVSTFSVNGSRGRSNNFLLDGTENNDISVAGQAFQIKIPEAVQEVSVQTANFDAEFGRAGGAVVNTITKSGTNEFHGHAAWLADFTNDDAISNTQSTSTDIQRRGRLPAGYEQFYSGTLGGRIVRDKTFFFVGWQELRRRATNTTNLDTLTAAGRAQLRSVFPAGVNPRVDLYLSVTDGVNGSGNPTFQDLGNGRGTIQFGRAVLSYPYSVNGRQSINKVDHRFSDSDLLSVRYGYDDLINAVSNPGFPGFSTSQVNRFHNAVITETHIFSPSLTNELRLPYNRIDLSFPNDASDPRAQTLPLYSITGLSSIGVSGNFPQGRVANNFVLQDTVSWVRGRHTVRFGLDLLEQRSRQTAPAALRGSVSYANSNVGGQSFSQFANFVDDFAGSGSVSRTFGNPTYYPELFRQAYFVQDRWKIRENVTLTLGLRWEDFGTPANSLVTPAYTGLFNTQLNAANRTVSGPSTLPNETDRDLNNFSPVIGLTWSPRFRDGLLGSIVGDSKSVFRSGYSIGYDSFFNNIASNAATSSPNSVVTGFTSIPTSAAQRGFANISQQIPTVARVPLPIDNQSLVLKNLRNPYYQRWSFGWQRELPGSFVLDSSYVGSSGTRLFLDEDQNPVLVDPSRRVLPAGYTSIPQLLAVLPADYTMQNTNRLDPLQGSRSIRGNGGHSSYHSAQFELTKRFTEDFGFKAAATFSKLLDNASDVFGFNNSPGTAAVPFIFGGDRLEKSVSLYDRPYRVVLVYGYQLPFFRQQRGLAGKVLGGWVASGITTFESGVPVTVTNGVDADGVGGLNDRPDYNPNGQAGVRARPDSSSPTGYVNPDVLSGGRAVPINPQDARYIGLPQYTVEGGPRIGTTPRNSERTPGINNWNFNVFKRVKLGDDDTKAVEFRTEFYNLFNHPQYGVSSPTQYHPAGGTPASNVNGSQPGRFLNYAAQMDGGGRVIRYQLKFEF